MTTPPRSTPTTLGFAGPGVKHLGLDGSGPAHGPNSAGANSGQHDRPSTPANPGTWTDETDIQPTELYLTGLHDRLHPGRPGDHPIVADRPPPHLRSPPVHQLAACYKQLNSSVGQFGAYTLVASTEGGRVDRARATRSTPQVNARHC